MAKENCESCGSSDAKEVYDNGQTHCFSCGEHTFLDGNKGQLASTRFPYDNSSDQWLHSSHQQKSTKENSMYPEGEAKALNKRKIKAETCLKFGYKSFSHNSRSYQAANVYDRKAKVYSRKLKFVKNNKKSFSWTVDSKMSDTLLFGQHLWLKGGNNNDKSRLVICEGEIDAMTVAQCFDLKWPVVSGWTGSGGLANEIKNNFEWVNSFSSIVLCFDNDEKGKEATEECRQLFDSTKVKIVNYQTDAKDANELLMETSSPADVMQLIYNAAPYKPRGVLSGLDLRRIALEKQEPGFMLDVWPGLTKGINGFKYHESYLFTAGPGMGKTSMVHELSLELMRQHGLRCACFGLEDTAFETISRYASLQLNKNIDNQDVIVTDDEINKALDELKFDDGHFLLHDTGDGWGSMDIDRLMDKITYFIVAQEVDFIILDHITIAISGLAVTDERKAIDMLMTKLNAVLKAHNVFLLTICHLRNTDKKNFCEGSRISLKDLRGSGGLGQLSSIVIGLEGDDTDEANPTRRQCRIVKNRKGSKKFICEENITYDWVTGRLLPNVDDKGWQESTEVKPEF